MKYLKKTLRFLLKSLYAILLIILIIIAGTSVSLIYDFAKPEPFSGADIFNPYRNIDTTHCWKKASFHTHTRVKGIFNECEYWPDEVYRRYEKLGYDIVTFSNHNELTEHPFDKELQVNVYEHGYNLFKFHKLVFGSDEVMHFDHLLPVLPSQMQFQIDLLRKGSDIVQFNHPRRTMMITREVMEKVYGYDIIEIDCKSDTECEYWDWALSAGRYSFGLASDDLHYPDKSFRIARRCSFICSPSGRYEDIKRVLLEGGYYSMRIPDYGDGDWEIKTRKNHELPYVTKIGLNKDTIFIGVSQVADSIKVFGQGHAPLLTERNCDHATYVMKEDDPYARFTVYFPEGEVIFSNPFARYDASVADSPVRENLFSVNIMLTILFNAMLIALIILFIYTFYKTIIKR